MAIYDTEEEQVEALKRWWKENSQSTIIGVAVGLSLMFGINFWRSHQQEKHEKASVVYEQMLEADKQNKPEQIEQVGQQVLQQYGSTAYADYVGLFEAKAKVAQGDLGAAKTILEKLVATADDEIKNIAKLRLLSLMLALGEYEQGLKLVAQTDAAAMQGYASAYEELKGDLYVALNRTDEARTSYQNAQREGSQSPLLQFKLDDLTAAETVIPVAAAAPTSTPAPAGQPATP